MFECSARAPGSPDELFLERLDTFMEKYLTDIKTFSEREHRPFEEIRQYVAEWHAKYLFNPPSVHEANPKQDTASKVLSVLYDASRLLESLCEVSGVQSFVLAVDPHNPADGGFLGGSISGREFWRGLRGGGETGAKAFRSHCLRDLGSQATSMTGYEMGLSSSGTSSVSIKSTPAKSLKSNLYDQARKALRVVSGVRNAEMKWTNPERLDIYGVRLVGWPPTIPAQNPSSLKASQNQRLLQCLENGTMKFEKIASASETAKSGNNSDAEDIHDISDENIDFSWAYDIDSVDTSLDTNPQRRDTYHLQPSHLHVADSYLFTDSGCSNDNTSTHFQTPNNVEPPSRKRLRNDTTSEDE